MEKFKELKQHLNEVSKNFAQLEKHIGYFESSLNSDFVLSVCDNHLIASASYPSIQLNSNHVAAIIEEGDVKGIQKSSIYYLVHAELFGYPVTCGLDEHEYKEFIEACKNKK